jgi:hypothetical protein
MGRLVKLWKSAESDHSVAYRYGLEQNSSGLLVMDKHTGVVSGIEPVPGMAAQDSWFLYGMLAKAKAEKMFKLRDFPAEASMAS